MLFSPFPIAFVTGLTAWSLFICFWLFGRFGKVYEGFRLWTMSAAVLGITGILVGLRPLIPEFLSIVASNLLGLGALLMIRRGIAHFHRTSVNWITDLGLLVLMAVNQILFTFAYPHFLIRSAGVSGFHSIAFILCALVALRPETRKRTKIDHLLVGLFIGTTIFHLLRMIAFLVFVLISLDHLQDVLFGASLIMMNVTAILIYGGLLALNAQRLSTDLQCAVSEARTLKGLLPICCVCKKIRSESQTWEPIEIYIRERSSAEFTHSLCPDCMAAQYPDENF